MNENLHRSENLLAALDKSFEVFRTTASNFPRTLIYKKPTEIAFSATEIVYHMVDVERLWQRRIRGLLDGTMKEFLQMNPDTVAIENRYNEKNYEHGIAELAQARKETHGLIQSMKLEAFERAGTHSKYGAMNTYDILETMEHHDRNHAAQLERTLVAITLDNNSTTL